MPDLGGLGGLFDLGGLASVHAVEDGAGWSGGQADWADPAPGGDSWLDEVLDAALGAGRGEEHLQMDSAMDPSPEMPVFPGLEELLNGFELPADPATALPDMSPLQGSWSTLTPQNGGGAPEHRWQPRSSQDNSPRTGWPPPR